MGAIKPIINDHDATWHMDKFVRFARAKDAIGEPTPHMRVVDWMSKDVTDAERMWRAGCYLTAYSVITGEGIWNSWSWKKIQKPDGFSPWLRENWGGIHTRKPRRCVRTPEQFSKSLLGFAVWARDEVPKLRKTRWASERQEYDGWWESAHSIPYYGRYVIIRLLELFRRWGYLKAHLYDIRAVGAHSPIRCLMLLEPQSVPLLLTGEARGVDKIARRVKESLDEHLSFFTYATLLCEYRSCYEDGTDYAGNQHDEELEYSLSRYAEFWKKQGLKSQLYPARAAIDPHECLGELQGWHRRRLDVASWMRDRSVVWSDLEFDYIKTLAAGKPVVRRKQHGTA